MQEHHFFREHVQLLATRCFLSTSLLWLCVDLCVVVHLEDVRAS